VDEFFQGKTALTNLLPSLSAKTAAIYSTGIQMLIKKTLRKRRDPAKGSASTKSIEVCQDLVFGRKPPTVQRWGASKTPFFTWKMKAHTDFSKIHRPSICLSRRMAGACPLIIFHLIVILIRQMIIGLSLQGAIATKQSRNSGSTRTGHEGNGQNPQPRRFADRDNENDRFRGSTHGIIVI